MAAKFQAIEYDFRATPFGDCLIARTPRGLCRLEFTEGDREAALGRLREAQPGANLQRVPLAELVSKVFGQSPGDSLPVDAQGTPFQQAVWRALRRIPRGATRSYGELAAAIGRPGAARAVGRAVASNSLAVVVPCHRVLPATGGTGGYRWGSERKTALLAWEAAQAA